MLTAILATLCLSQAPLAATVEDLPFDVQALRKLPQVEATIKTASGSTTYKGVPLRALIAARLDPNGGMPALRKLSDASLIVRAGDDYQVAFSAAEVALDENGEKYLVALEQDGKPLDSKHAPAQIVIPGESGKRVRWIRNVESVHLVRIPKIEPSPKPAK